MSDISKALDRSRAVVTARQRGRLHRRLSYLREKSRHRPLLLIFAACACLTAVGAIWMPTVRTQNLSDASIDPGTRSDPILAAELDKLIVKVIVSDTSPRVLTEKGLCRVNDELIPGLYLSKIENFTLIAIDKNGAVYRKKF